LHALLLDQAKGELVSRIVIGEQVRSIRVRVGHGIAGTVAKTGKAIRLRDAYTDPRFEPEWDLFTGYRTRSMLAAPLKNHMGRTIGVIQVLNKTVGEEFTAEDEAILSALSTQAAVAIDNSRLFLSLIQKNHQLLSTKEKLERRVADLQLLNELERAYGPRRIPRGFDARRALCARQGLPGPGRDALARRGRYGRPVPVRVRHRAPGGPGSV
jgi:GAF domain-containing protein